MLKLINQGQGWVKIINPKYNSYAHTVLQLLKQTSAKTIKYTLSTYKNMYSGQCIDSNTL